MHINRLIASFALVAAAGGAAPLAAQETLTIGTEAAYPPFAYVLPSGEMTGFDIDIANALCAEMEMECEISNLAFDGLIPALTSKKIDAIIASMFITEDRLKAIDFAGPYYLTPALFIGPEDADLELTEDGCAARPSASSAEPRWPITSRRRSPGRGRSSMTRLKRRPLTLSAAGSTWSSPIQR